MKAGFGTRPKQTCFPRPLPASLLDVFSGGWSDYGRSAVYADVGSDVQRTVHAESEAVSVLG